MYDRYRSTRADTLMQIHTLLSDTLFLLVTLLESLPRRPFPRGVHTSRVSQDRCGAMPSPFVTSITIHCHSAHDGRSGLASADLVGTVEEPSRGHWGVPVGDRVWSLAALENRGTLKIIASFSFPHMVMKRAFPLCCCQKEMLSRIRHKNPINWN